MSIRNESKNRLSRTIAVAIVAAGLVVSPLSLRIGSLQGSAAAQTAAPGSSATDSKAAKTKKPPSAGQVAMHERQKKCAAEWKQAKDGGKLEKGATWPKFWSACNKRLKSAS